MNNYKPKYPIYVPSYNRYETCYTANFFLKDGVDFKIVVEPKQYKFYKKYFDDNIILVMPDDNMKLLGTRLWIREYSIKNGFERHWQFDDNIRCIQRLHKGKRIRCNANIGIYFIEKFTDRYANIGISGFNYEMFVTNVTQSPYFLNCHVYSASLINNNMIYKWRLFYNDDTDLCLQVLTNNMCTVLFNTFMASKIVTMSVRGGNTDQLYKKNGRLIMARTLEEIWPEHVETKWRFGRPQHVIKNNWRQFTTPLKRRNDIDWNKIKNEKHEIKLNKIKDIKSNSLKDFYNNYNKK